MEGNGIVKPDWLHKEIYDILPDFWRERMVDSKTIDELKPEIKKLVEEYLSKGVQEFLLINIARSMKEIPILPSEIPVPHDTYPLLKVEFPPEGGVMSYQEGTEHPYRGYPYFEVVEKIDLIKKVARASLSGLYHALKKRKWFLFTLLPSIWVFKHLLTAGVYTLYRIIERTRIKSHLYCQALRELHRVFSIPRKENNGEIEFRLMVRDLVCMVLEFDNAYRFRAQDIIAEIDKKSLKDGVIKELNRVFTIAQQREKTQEIRDTWKLAKLFVSLYLRFDGNLKKLVCDVLGELSIEKFKLTTEDKIFCVKRNDYIFGFMQ